MQTETNKPERSYQNTKEINLREYADRSCKKCALVLKEIIGLDGSIA